MSERMPRRGRSSIAASPVLIGAVSVLIALVSIVLSYNANSGLPFVETYDVRVEVPDAAGLVAGNDVREGGARIGQLGAIEPFRARDGGYGALLVLKLDRSAGPLPEDTRLAVRPRSPLGLRYIELTRGSSRRTLANGSTIALRHAAPIPVEFDDLFETFDAPTRAAAPEATEAIGTAIAGRGAGLNHAIRGLLPLVTRLEPAARNLADPRTGLGRLLPALGRTAGQLRPVAEPQARMFTALAGTFGALARVRTDLQESIAAAPRMLEVGIEELPRQARFVRAATDLSRRLRPGVAMLSASAPDLDAALRSGAPALRRLPALDQRLERTFADLDRFDGDDRVHTGLKALAGSMTGVQPLTAFLTPAQTVCNYGGLLLRNLASSFSEADAIGSMMRFSVVLPSQVAGSEAGPAATPSNGPQPPVTTGAPADNFLHSNPYPNTAAPGQEPECEAGNEGYRKGSTLIGNVPGDQGRRAEPTGRFVPVPAKDGR